MTLDGTIRPTSCSIGPDPHDEENMDARPDQEEMEQAINKFLQQLEKQEKKGFKDLATLLSHLPKLAQGSARSMSVAEALEAGFLPALDKIRPICSPGVNQGYH